MNKFSRFKDKIRFIVADYNKEIDFRKHIGGESPIEQHQRNSLSEGIKDANPNDLIILSDTDEIPDLTKLSEIRKKLKKFIAFSHQMFMYKLNLKNLDESNWIGSKITKKYLKSMQSLRNLKFKNYPFWRIDKFHLQIINGGWHFSFLQTPEQILNKVKSFSHGEYDDNNLDKSQIAEKFLIKKIFLIETYLLKKLF